MDSMEEMKDVSSRLEKYQSTRDPKLKNTMSVPEMRRLLGLKKTESYWLVHRNFFETKMINGLMRVDLESFEKWYVNQVKHKKVTGEKPGTELSKSSYSFREAANLLGVHESDLYNIWKNENRAFITVDYVKRIPFEEFEKWYADQDKYQKLEKIPNAEELETYYIPMLEAAKLLKIENRKMFMITTRDEWKDIFEVIVIDCKRYISKKGFQHFLNAQNVYQIKKRKKINTAKQVTVETKNYISRQEAARIAGVTPATITKWLQMERFSGVGAGKVLRINRKEFLKWMEVYKKGAV